MKILRGYPLLLGTLLVLASAPALADGYNLQLTGTILSRTCEVDSSSQKQTVEIGEFSVYDFATSGSVSRPKGFDIILKDCGSAATGAVLSFTGTSDAADPALLALSDTGGAGAMASGIAVQILNDTQQSLDLNSASPPTYTLVPGDNTLSFYLRYKSTQDVVTAGNATAVMYFDLQYQ
ncbi:fimbrial protein [Rahnella woolbedingensis]|uniref:Fimbrial protein n=1 Tax=Rahnella woolbedingensis TaxID=1510574 RepID=A0A419N1W1_9GAMM|nr:fimbrial protein [Rahnella woolbedingensis]RJT32578.1 fimbrial protein [Rahnella woolbedingensis]